MDIVNRFGVKVHLEQYRYIAYRNVNKVAIFLGYADQKVYIIENDYNGVNKVVFETNGFATPALHDFFYGKVE